MQSKISIGVALKKAWRITAKNWLVLVGLFLTYYALSLLFNFLFSSASMFSILNYGSGIEHTTLTKITFTQNLFHNLSSLLISCVFTYVYTQVSLDCLKGIEPRFKFSFSQFGYYLLTFFAIVLFFVGCMLIGSLILPYSIKLFVAVWMLLALVSIYLSIRIQFFVLLMIDKSIKPFAAIKQSWNITKRNIGKLILLILLEFGILLIGLLAFLIGFFYAFPLIIILQVCVYEQMMDRVEIMNEF